MRFERAWGLAIAVALGCVLSACSGGPAREVGALRAPAAKAVILISIDGFRPDYFERGLTPTLARLAAEGTWADSLKPSMPTLTFPNHYTLVTGLHPDHHGVIGNTMNDDRKPGVRFSLGNREAVGDGFWWSDAEPIWVTAEKAGMRTATMFWPGSEAEIHGVRPSEWRAYDKNVTYEQRVDTVLGWLDRPDAQRPRLVTLYFESVDTSGHNAGPDSAEVNLALRETDGALARLVEGLKSRGTLDSTNLVIVSDHGMAELSEDRVVYLEDYCDPELFTIEAGGVMTMIRPSAGREAEVLGKLQGAHPHLFVWAKSEVPTRFAFGTHRRVSPIVALADVGWTIRSRQSIERGKPMRATHGFDNDSPLMAGLFVARGPDVARGVRVGEVWAVDVQPLLAWMLGLRVAKGDGDWARVAGVVGE